MPPATPDDHTTGFGLLVPGTMVSHFCIVSKIGSGGMGDVYLADDTKLNRRAALKFLPSHLAADATLRARFTREVQAVAALNHPNIVHVYEVSEFNRRPYFAMEYVEGQSLRELMRDRQMPFAEAVSIAIGLCEGLEAAHKVGIVHRDIKPANLVLATSGRVKILDFGLAKRASDPTLTSMGSTLGTICYMSPEQVQGRDSDHRSDLFSVGIVIYEMIAGRLPFREDYDAATLTAIVSVPHAPLARRRPDVPQKLTGIVDRLLAKDTAQRYQDVGAVLADLHAMRDELNYAARPHQSVDKPAPSRKILMFGVVGVVALAVLAIAMVINRTADVPTNSGAVNSGTTQPLQPKDSPINSETDLPTVAVVPAPEAPATIHDRTAHIAESIASAGESRRLKALRDSIENERTRLAKEQTQFAETQSRQSTNPTPDQNSLTPPVVTPPAPVKLEPRIDRGADSIAIDRSISQFWDNLEQGKFKNLRDSYPSMPADWESTWRTFVDYAEELDIQQAMRQFDLEDGRATASIAVKMTFRDRSGQKTENVNYHVALARKDTSWMITEMERNR